MSNMSLSEKKKEMIINKVMHDALHFFEKNGYDGTTVEQLCQEAMISNTTFFNYFGTKEKIVEIIMEDGLKDYMDFAETAFDGMEDPFNGLKSALDFQAGVIDKYSNIISVFHRLALQREDFRRLEQAFIDYTGELVLRAYQLSGRECPYSVDMLKDIVGGYFIIPFLCAPPEEAGRHVRKTTEDFIEVLKSS